MIRFTPESIKTDALKQFLEAWENDASDLICKTSGSTGVPKEIAVSKKAMWYSAHTTVNFFSLGNVHRALLCLPCDFIAGRMMLVRAMAAGMEVHSVRPSGNPLLHKIPHKIDFAAFTPPQVSAALAHDFSKKQLSGISVIIIGGAALSSDLEAALAAMGNDVFVTYGMTETISHIALRRVGEEYYTLISADTRISTDSEGCLILENEHLFTGRLHTHDVVEISSRNQFKWLGRKDFVINSGGVKIHPEQVEHKIGNVHAWQGTRFILASEPHPVYGERPVLIVEGYREVPNLDTLKSVLSKIEMPGRVVRVNQFETTSNGKVNRAATLRKALE